MSDVPAASSGEVKSEAELEAAILKQVEYYFSDANFPRDKFMIAETAKTPEQWINLATIASFNRMKALNPSLDLAILTRALKDSTALELSEDSTQVRREVGRWQKAIGGKMFGSRQEVMAYARSLIAEGGAAEGGAIPEEGQAFVTALLHNHANPAEKIGSGVASVKVGCNPEYPDTKCFVIVRTDGTEVDFSYLKCIDNIYPKAVGEAIRRSDRKRPRDEINPNEAASSDAPPPKKGPAAGEPAEPFTKGLLLVVKELPEGETVQSIKGKFTEAIEASEGKVKFVDMVDDAPLAYVRFDSVEAADAGLTLEGFGQIEKMEGEDEEAYWE